MSRDASREAEAYRHRTHEAEGLAERRLQVIEEQRKEILATWARSWLIDPSDFEVFIGHENVVGPDERIDWVEANLRRRALLKTRPHLGVVVDLNVGDES